METQQMDRLSLCVMALLATAGCGSSQPGLPLDDSFHGELDPQLPPAQRAQQEAVYRGLESLRDGAPFERLTEAAPGVVWQENEQQFYEQGARLLKWDWAGPPEGNRFPVTLTMQKNEPGLVTVDQRKIYVVERDGRRHKVAPAPER